MKARSEVDYIACGQDISIHISATSARQAEDVIAIPLVVAFNL
ncbi:MAG: hypothetical protein ACRD8O_14315 [Bryobacteraceae bacterium]